MDRLSSFAGRLVAAFFVYVVAGVLGNVANAQIDPVQCVIQCAPPFCMSVEDGAAIGAAIVAVWGAAWAFKALITVLRSDERD